MYTKQKTNNCGAHIPEIEEQRQVVQDAIDVS